MTDKIKFIDVKYLTDRYRSFEERHKRSIFCPRFLDNHVCSEKVDIKPMDILPYLELTRFQCQIIRDNIVEIIRFADTGEYNG